MLIPSKKEKQIFPIIPLIIVVFLIGLTLSLFYKKESDSNLNDNTPVPTQVESQITPKTEEIGPVNTEPEPTNTVVPTPTIITPVLLGVYHGTPLYGDTTVEAWSNGILKITGHGVFSNPDIIPEEYFTTKEVPVISVVVDETIAELRDFPYWTNKEYDVSNMFEVDSINTDPLLSPYEVLDSITKNLEQQNIFIDSPVLAIEDTCFILDFSSTSPLFELPHNTYIKVLDLYCNTLLDSFTYMNAVSVQSEEESVNW